MAKPKTKNSSPINVDEKFLKHETKLITIKSAYVDIEIIPVVNWLNSFPFIQTLFSCQGNKNKDESISDAYVSFLCENNQDLAEVLQKIELAAKEDIFIYVSVDSYAGHYPIRYNLNMTNKNMLAFVDFIDAK